MRNVLREKIDGEDSITRSGLSHLSNNIERDSALLEAFYLGMKFSKSLGGEELTSSSWYSLFIKSVEKREWDLFKDHVLALLDIKGTPTPIKESSTQDEFFSHIKTYFAEKSIPTSLSDIKDVIEFNHQYKSYLRRLTETFKPYENLDVDKTPKLAVPIKSKISISKCGQVYNSKYCGKKIISIDIVQANFTALRQYHKLRSLEPDLSVYSSWREYVKTLLGENELTVLIGKSKLIRQIVLGKLQLQTLIKRICSYMLIPLAEKLSEIVSVTMDEIVLQNANYEEVMKIVNDYPYKDNLKVQEFILARHKLKSGKYFYTKKYTDGSVSMHSVNPDDLLEAKSMIY